MSIWCSDTTTGFEDTAASRKMGLASIPIGGQVLAFADGFSNHHPDRTTGRPTQERPAAVHLASIAPWCVPGHLYPVPGGTVCGTCRVGHDYPECGPWVRLDLDSPNALTWWSKDDLPKPQPAPFFASVVLDEPAARALAAHLIAWADRPKVYPVKEDA